ncbi:MerR family transcriptional regulator [Nakamurella sp.]|uniref:MerR family transcriptional regulator n=1 Tax=Nakamurella sp. TaxID=1869182 RepID=UPI003B3B36AB
MVGEPGELPPVTAVRDGSMGVYGITVAAELSGLSAQALRLYERKGLLQPDRTTGGTRRYSDADIERLRRISELIEDGINLIGIARVLGLEDDNTAIRGDNHALRTDNSALRAQNSRLATDNAALRASNHALRADTGPRTDPAARPAG